MILSNTNIVLHLVEFFLCSLGLAEAKKSCNKINNSCAQVSRLYFVLWLCFNGCIL